MSPASSLDRSLLISTLQELVRINSINPGLVPGAPGESSIAAYVEAWLQKAGIEAVVHEAAPGRPSVVGILRGEGGGRTLMLSAHLDTVGIQGMNNPFGGEYREGKVYGRGAYDMKGSLAACLLAIGALAQTGRRRGDVTLGGAADE